MPYTDLVKKAYTDQKNLAKGRGIPFLLSFEEWKKIWDDSGRFNQRGKKTGKYCMARFGDKGAYEVSNVEIILVEHNIRDRNENIHVLSSEVKQEIKKQHIKGSRGENSSMSLARKYSINVATVRNIVNDYKWVKKESKNV